ncbi:MAG: hypothetical protein ACLTQI_07095 [Slackia sp.]
MTVSFEALAAWQRSLTFRLGFLFLSRRGGSVFLPFTSVFLRSMNWSGKTETEALMAAVPEDASARDTPVFGRRCRLAELTFAWCKKTGREDSRLYAIRRCGEAGAVLFEEKSWEETP